MSRARSYGINGQALYANIAKPMECNLSFLVSQTDAGGLGVTSLKSNGFVESVFMHTSATPGSVNGNVNPNPAVGYAMVKFKNNFNKFINSFQGQTAPLASTNLTSTVAGNVYVITLVGTTTLAQYQARGLPQGIVPAVGVAFVATSTGALGGTGNIGAPGIATTMQMAVIGDPNMSIANSNISRNAGAYVLIQFLAPTDAATTTLIATNPPNGTLVKMEFKFDGSSVTVDGL